MKERPMLYAGAMVRAVLADAKTMTRRVMKVQPSEGSTVTVERYEPAIVSRSGELVPGPEVFGAHWGDGEFGLVCPYGEPGDRLWVRETYADAGCRLTYRADEDDGAHCVVEKWIPSIHMPRAACRLVLEITDIRVERLQDISEADAIAEGCDNSQSAAAVATGWYEKPISAYRRLWESLYGAGSWDANPYVWRISFKKVEA